MDNKNKIDNFMLQCNNLCEKYNNNFPFIFGSHFAKKKIFYHNCQLKCEMEYLKLKMQIYELKIKTK